MRYAALHAAEIVGASLLLLALAALPAHGQSLGEVTAATGIHGTLSRQSTGSAAGTLGSVKSSLARSTKPKDLGFGSSGAGPRSKPSRAKSAPSRSRGARSGGSSGRGSGSWVTGASTSRGSASSAWVQGGNGWSTGGGGRSPARRPRS